MAKQDRYKRHQEDPSHGQREILSGTGAHVALLLLDFSRDRPNGTTPNDGVSNTESKALPLPRSAG
jgi:hypothetical protein